MRNRIRPINDSCWKPVIIYRYLCIYRSQYIDILFTVVVSGCIYRYTILYNILYISSGVEVFDYPIELERKFLYSPMYYPL